VEFCGEVRRSGLGNQERVQRDEHTRTQDQDISAPDPIGDALTEQPMVEKGVISDRLSGVVQNEGLSERVAS
jgi:hypothetical protein